MFCKRDFSIAQLCPDLWPVQAMGGSISAARFLVSKGHANVNEPAGNTGLTPLMCSVLNRNYPNSVSTHTVSQAWHNVWTSK